MATKTALFALLAVWGVGAYPGISAVAEETEVEAADSEQGSEARRNLVNRVWVRSDEDQRPGVIRIFLSDGTLVQDSCWETHRLSEWKMTSDTSVTWNEDGIDIAADIVSVGSDALVLNVKLGRNAVEERYNVADVPFVCPDLPKS